MVKLHSNSDGIFSFIGDLHKLAMGGRKIIWWKAAQVNFPIGDKRRSRVCLLKYN